MVKYFTNALQQKEIISNNIRVCWRLLQQNHR